MVFKNNITTILFNINIYNRPFLDFKKHQYLIKDFFLNIYLNNPLTQKFSNMNLN